MADNGNTPKLPGGGNGNIPKLPGSGGGARNPLEKKEYDILDPEATPKSKGQKGLNGVVEGAKKTVDKIKRIINFIKNIPPQALLVIAIIILIIFIVGGIIGFFLFIPGLTINALKQFAQGAIDVVESWFTTAADAYINEQDVIDLANYLEEMEYDLVGYGFITPNSNYASFAGFKTYTELMDDGYIYFEKRGDDENARYYNEAGEAYDGYYYNSLGVLVDNETGQIITGEYTDKFGLQRSTEEITNSGAGKIVGFGEDFAALGITGSILDHLLDWTVDTKLLRTYLLSDYRIYSIRNNDQGLLENIFKGIKQTFGGYDAAWSKGLIKFYYSQNGLATSEWSDGLGRWIIYGDDISITRTSTGAKMSVKNGHFNNPTVFTIDGWADRYGMSLEFLLSLHIATMQPDLVYAMLQNFDTEVQVYLDDSGESTVDAAYVDMLNSEASSDNEEDRIMIDDVEQTLAEGGFDVAAWAVNDMAATQWVNRLAITKKNAYYLLRNLPLESPPNCTGQAQAYVIEESTYETNSFLWMDTSTNALTTYGITQDIDSEPYDDMSDYTNYSFDDDNGNPLEFTAEHCTQEIGTDNPDYENDTYSWLAGYADDYGFSTDTAEVMEPQIDNTLVTEASTISNVYSDGTGMTGGHTLNHTEYSIKKVKQERTWDVEVTLEDGSTEFINYEWITYKYLIYKTKTYKTNYTYSSTLFNFTENTSDPYDEEEFDNEWVDTVIIEFFVREKNTDELIDANLAYRDEEGNVQYRDVADTRCSDNEEIDKCCSNCKRYVKDVIEALGVVSDQNYASYTPYIARVLGSWFRDTYFIVPEEIGINRYDENGNLIVEKDYAIYDYIEEASRSSAEMSMIRNSYGENSSFVIVDEEYLAETGEYWTAYEMNGDNYQLYYLYPNGITSDYKMEDFIEDPYTALESYQTGYAERYDITSGMKYDSEEEAEDAGHAFVKKAKTRELNELSSSSLENVLWSAYEFSSNGATTGWIRIEYEDNNEAVNDVYDTVGEEYPNSEGGFYYNITSTNKVTQAEDAQRSETNPTVKWLFKYRKYYTYDNSEETALRIADDKEAVLTWVEDYLIREYGRNAGTVASKLGEYGRNALRQTYNNLSIVFDWVDISEEWLDWQLDMYYSGIIECSEDDYKLGNLAFIVTTDDDENVISIVETTDFDYQVGENQELRIGDPRNPDLIGTTNITKTSLEAFTILENTKTLAAEYAYRDFKELIVELDYFDKEDLSDAISAVFTWVLPEISPAGWPIRPFDKQDVEYGALIGSHGTYEALGVIFSSDGNSGADIDESKITFIGDSWIEGLTCAESSYKWPATGMTATYFLDNFSSASSYIHSDTSAIVICLGMNNPSSYNKTQELINKLKQEFPNIPIYNLAVVHIAEQNSTAVTNGQIDSYNQQMQSYCNSTDGVTYIDPSDNLVSSGGWLKPEYSGTGGYHLNSSGYEVWYNNIINGIKTGGNNNNNNNNNNSSSSGNDENGSGMSIVEAAKEVAEMIEGWSYGSNHDDLSLETRRTHETDCSGYVTAVLIKVGYFDQSQMGSREPGAIEFWNQGTENVYSNQSGWDYVSQKLQEMEKVQDTSGGNGYINEDQLQPGDIISWAHDESNYRRGGHVAIYMGEGKIYEVTRGVGFRERDYSNGEWTRAYRVTSLGNGTVISSFNGYEGGEYVSSPVTGKIIEYGTHERINVYTGDTEEVGYVVIEAIKSEDGFTEDNVANNSADTEGMTNEDVAIALNLFYDEYKDTCAGYTITIDGFKVDLNTTDGEGNNGSYEQNEVFALYNSSEQEKREANEQAKDDAPFFINYNGGADLGNLPETYINESNSSEGYYIKEGKYLGVTYTDEESAALTVTTDPVEPAEPIEPTNPDPVEPTTPEPTEPEPTSGETEHTGPANYIRIMVKDREYSIIDNVEDYFNIPEPEEDSGSNSYSDPELLDLEILFFSIGEGGPWIDYNTPAGEWFKSRTNNPNGLTFVANSFQGDNLEVGIIQWTTNSRGLTGIQNFCASAYQYDSSIFGALSGYANCTNEQYLSNSALWTSLANDMLDIWNSNPDELMAFEIQFAKEGYLQPCLNSHPWLANRPGVVQGMVMSIQVYNGNIGMLNLSDSMTDEEIIDECQPYLNGRTWQSGFAKAYLRGEINEEQLKEFIYYGTIDGAVGTSLY